jgi:2'-5' RNA ligase
MTRALRTAGLAFQKRRFRPHVTLARLPKHLPDFELARLRDFLAEHAAFRGSCFDVNSFRFCRSLLRPGGAVYETLERYALAGAEEGRN